MIISNKQRTFFSPGRINLLGEHLDYNGGWVLPAAIDKGIYLKIVPQSERCEIRLEDGKQGYFHEKTELSKLPNWLRYPFGIWKEMKAKNSNIQGFIAELSADLPTGAGLSSSAALCSVFAYALNELYNCQLLKIDLALIAQIVEHTYIGVNCGIMDQFAVLHGKENHVIKLQCADLQYEYFQIKTKNYAWILVDTCVKHTLSDSPYNKRRANCEKGLKEIKCVFPEISHLALANISQLSVVSHELSAEELIHCTYVIEEQNRVEKFVNAIENKDIDAIGTLLFETHDGLKNKYKVSCEEADFLVEFAQQDKRAKGARMMGGGFGGCTIHFVIEESTAAYSEAIATAYFNKFGIQPCIYSVKIGEGTREIL
jgi:galactokinase